MGCRPRAVSASGALLRISESGPLPGYRPCVGMMVVNPAGLVFIGERRGLLGGWQMPQGGIDRGERPCDAALRELVEEIGTDRIEPALESSRWYAYDLPPEQIPKFHGGRERRPGVGSGAALDRAARHRGHGSAARQARPGALPQPRTGGWPPVRRRLR